MRVARAGLGAWLVAGSALAAVGAPACTEETIVLADVPPAGPAPDGGPPPDAQRCASVEDCPRGLYCDKPACDAPAGVCRRLPSLCPDDERPVCGCDGVTYFNDCLRRLGSVAFAHEGECIDGLLCGRGRECPGAATCAQLVPRATTEETCPPELPGTCWVIPERCPPAETSLRWELCGAAGERCLGTCEAIAAGAPARRAERCP